MHKPDQLLRVAFVVPSFPVVTETFVINQIADLLDEGVQVEVFAFKKGPRDFISSRYEAHRMEKLTHYVGAPSLFRRVLRRIPKLLKLLRLNPVAVIRLLNAAKYGKQAVSLRLIDFVEPFAGTKFDVVHCHFGDAANSFLIIKDILGIKTPMVTTFYGSDVSRLVLKSAPDVYDRLQKECDLFFVMSEDMKRRVQALGFPKEKIVVNPASNDVSSYLFSERRCAVEEPVEIVSVGRFVEKKGFDDLLRALAKAREMTSRSFRCSIIGSGHLENELRALATSLELDGMVHFMGYMKNEDVDAYLTRMHIMVQPSKTASDGDME